MLDILFPRDVARAASRRNIFYLVMKQELDADVTSEI